MAPEVLARALSNVTVYPDSNVLVGFETADDGAVYLLDSERALVQTVDFFTPIVDDPYLFGQIAAANSLSDIYAMGARPLFALSVVCFPDSPEDEGILKEIVEGGAAKLNEAQVPLLGGHSVQDSEIKFGYAVTGLAHPDRILANEGCRMGDLLILTKPLGTGVIGTAIKFGKASPETEDAAVEAMLQLNGRVSRYFEEIPPHAATDITGFGFIGHASELARASEVEMVFDVERVPLLPDVRQLARRGCLPGGINSNRGYAGSLVDWSGVDDLSRDLLCDPQTSGGLLVSIDPEGARDLQKALSLEGIETAVVGEVVKEGEGRIRFGPLGAISD